MKFNATAGPTFRTDQQVTEGNGFNQHQISEHVFLRISQLRLLIYKSNKRSFQPNIYII